MLWKSHLKIIIPSLLLSYLLIGCTNATVMHLKKNPWRINQPQVLKMNYMIFHYTVYQDVRGIYVIGRAYPRREKIPHWGKWAAEIWLGVYLSDRRGDIIARDIRIYPPQEITSNGFPFTFIIKPQSFGGPGPLYITFGYRLKITDLPFSQKHKHPRVFFAIEKAQNLF